MYSQVLSKALERSGPGGDSAGEGRAVELAELLDGGGPGTGRVEDT